MREPTQPLVAEYNLSAVSGDDFFDRTEPLASAQDALDARRHVAVIGERRAGKTSLLQRLERLCAPRPFLFAALTQVEDDIAGKIKRADKGARPVVVCDEVDSLIMDERAPHGFLQRLLETAARHRLPLLLAGCSPLLSMLQATNVWTGVVVALRPMAPDDIRSLMAQPAQGQMEMSPDVHYAIYDYCGGQPWFAKLLGTALVQHTNRMLRSQGFARPCQVNVGDVEQAAELVLRSEQINMYWRNLTQYHLHEDEVTALQMLSRGAQPCTNDQLFQRLFEKGYIQKTPLGCALRAKLLARCIERGATIPPPVESAPAGSWTQEEHRCWSTLKERSPEVISYRELSAAIWPDASFDSHQQIRLLHELTRRVCVRINDDPEAPSQLREVPGRGYRMYVEGKVS